MKREILFLSTREKRGLVRYIRDTISPEALTGRDRCLYLVTMAERVFLRRLSPGRTREDVMIRSFVAYRLHGEGYSTTRIGKMIGRDHATVVHMIRKMEDILAYPGAYQDESEKYRRFENSL